MTEPAPQAAALSTRVLARRVVMVSVLGALVLVALSLWGDVHALAATLRAFPPLAFLAAIALASGNYLLRFVRWHFYLDHLGERVPLGESALVFLAGFVMSVTPGKIGEVLKSVLLLESRGLPIARTAPIVVAERLTDLVALVALMAVGALTFDRGVPATIVGAAVVGTVLLAVSWRAFGELLLRVAARLPGLGRFAPRLRVAYDSLHALTRPKPLLVGAVLGIVAWALECWSLGVVLDALGGPAIGWQAVTFAYAAPTIAGALAMMPGGLGVTEAGMAGLLRAVSLSRVSATMATAATILVRLATLWWAVLVGFIALALFRRMLNARLRASRRT